MRFVALLVLLGCTLLALGGWYLDRSQARRLDEGIHLLALDKFEPFYGPWLRLHQESLSFPVTVDFVHSRRFRMEMAQHRDDYDGFLVDVYDGTATRLRRDGLVGNFFGGPLKLVVPATSQIPAARRALGQALEVLRGQKIAVLAEGTPLGEDSRAWLIEEGGGIAADLRSYPNAEALLQAVQSGETGAAILRADIQEAAGTRVLAWRFMEGRPQEHFAPGLIMPPRSSKRALLADFWLRNHGDLRDFRAAWTPPAAQ